MEHGIRGVAFIPRQVEKVLDNRDYEKDIKQFERDYIKDNPGKKYTRKIFDQHINNYIGIFPEATFARNEREKERIYEEIVSGTGKDYIKDFINEEIKKVSKSLTPFNEKEFASDLAIYIQKHGFENEKWIRNKEKLSEIYLEIVERAGKFIEGQKDIEERSSLITSTIGPILDEANDFIDQCASLDILSKIEDYITASTTYKKLDTQHDDIIKEINKRIAEGERINNEIEYKVEFKNSKKLRDSIQYYKMLKLYFSDTYSKEAQKAYKEWKNSTKFTGLQEKMIDDAVKKSGGKIAKYQAYGKLVGNSYNIYDLARKLKPPTAT